jgi:hypothetical protein
MMIIFLIKASTSFECKYQVTLATLLVFIDIGEDLIMANDVTTPLNPLVASIKKNLKKHCLM